MKKRSDYDQSLVDGNRLRINRAVQDLETAYHNISKADSDTLREIAERLQHALDSLITYHAYVLDLTETEK